MVATINTFPATINYKYYKYFYNYFNYYLLLLLQENQNLFFIPGDAAIRKSAVTFKTEEELPT